MSYLELQSYQPDFYKPVLEMQEILKASGVVLDEVAVDVEEVDNNAFIQTLQKSGVAVWETILQIAPEERTLPESRSLIISKLRGIGKFNSESIKGIASAYDNGVVDVWFENSTIKVKYISEVGVPSNFSDFEAILAELKPSHLAISFQFKYNTYKVVGEKTHAELAAYTHEQIRNEAL